VLLAMLIPILPNVSAQCGHHSLCSYTCSPGLLSYMHCTAGSHAVVHGCADQPTWPGPLQKSMQHPPASPVAPAAASSPSAAATAAAAASPALPAACGMQSVEVGEEKVSVAAAKRSLCTPLVTSTATLMLCSITLRWGSITWYCSRINSPAPPCAAPHLCCCRCC
jgi:hypothetical protein